MFNIVNGRKTQYHLKPDNFEKGLIIWGCSMEVNPNRVQRIQSLLLASYIIALIIFDSMVLA